MSRTRGLPGRRGFACAAAFAAATTLAGSASASAQSGAPPVRTPPAPLTVTKMTPRAISPAEREAARLLAAYAESGPEAVWSALAADAPLRALGHAAALDEIRIRLGPSAGASWAMRTPGARHGADTAIFGVEFPSGLEDTLVFEFAASSAAAQPAGGPRLFALSCLVDPRGAAAAQQPPAQQVAAAVPPVGGAALTLIAVVTAAWCATGAARRRTESRLRSTAVAAAAAACAAVLLFACARREASPASAGAAPARAVNRLAALLPLREALAGASGADREELFAHLPAEGVARDAGRLWHAEELTLRGQLNQAVALLDEVKGGPYALAALLRARLAFLRGDAKATDAAFDEAAALGPDHDMLRLEAAQAATLLGDEGELEVALRQAGEMGSRSAGVYYGLAEIELDNDAEEDAEWLFGQAWRLQPLERATLLGRPGLAALCTRPALFGMLGMNQAQEPMPAPSDLAAASIAWPAGTVQRLTGARLGVEIAGASLDLPAGAPLAAATAVLEPPAARREREEAEALARLPALRMEAAAGAWARASLRHDVELAADALASRGRWQELLQLTETAEHALDQVSSEIVQMRALALRRSEREPEAKDLLVRLAKSDIANKRRDPSPFFQLAELMAGQDEIELALKLYRRALALAHVRSGSARLSQLELEEGLVLAAHNKQSAHFLLRYPQVTEERYATQLVGVLEQEWQRLQRWVPLSHPQRVKVDLFPVADFMRVYSDGVPVLGIFDGRVRVPLADLHSLRPLLVSILSHELAHALITERTHDHASKWLQEGLAQHIQMSDQSVNPFPELVRAGHQLSLPVVEAALDGFSDPQFVDVAYGQALWTVHFIEARWGRAGLGRLLDAYAAGGVGEQPLRQAFGLGYGEFDRALWAWAVDGAPSTWPTELRRYDVEAERAEVLRTTSDRRLAVAAATPPSNTLQTRAQAMQVWYAAYVVRVRDVKRALGPVIAAYRRDARLDVTASCSALETGLAGLLQDPKLLTPPDDLVAEPLRRAYTRLGELAHACRASDGRAAVFALDAAERALGDAAAAMKRWNLTP